MSTDYLLEATDDPTATLAIGTFAASSGLPINELDDENKEQLEGFAKYLISKAKDEKKK